MNAEHERGGDLLDHDFQLHDSRKENPKPLIDGTVLGLDNTKHSSLVRAFVGKMEAKRDMSLSGVGDHVSAIVNGGNVVSHR